MLETPKRRTNSMMDRNHHAHVLILLAIHLTACPTCVELLPKRDTAGIICCLAHSEEILVMLESAALSEQWLKRVIWAHMKAIYGDREGWKEISL